MFCPKCGRMNPDEGELCKGCGAVLHEAEVSAPVKKKRPLKAILITLAVLLVVCAVVVFVLVQTGVIVLAAVAFELPQMAVQAAEKLMLESGMYGIL